MIIHVKGNVNLKDQEFFACPDFSILQVRVYQATLDGSASTPFDTISVDVNGNFSKDITSTSGNIVLKLYRGTGETGLLVATSSQFCHHDEVNITFTYAPDLFGGDIFTQLIGAISPVTDPYNLQSLTDIQLTNLECLSCVKKNMLLRLKNTNLLWAAYCNFIDTVSTSYTAAKTTATALRSNSAVGIPVFFALSRFQPNLVFSDLLSYSNLSFTNLLNSAVSANEISNSITISTVVTQLVASRDIALFNTNNDNRYYDAKLIHLTANTYPQKKDLLDKAFDLSGVAGIIDSTNGAADGVIDKLKPILTFSSYLYDFAPLLKIAIDTHTATPNFFNLIATGYNASGSNITGVAVWRTIVDQLSLNHPSPFTPDPDGAAAYASAIFNRIGDLYPSARISNQISSLSLSNGEQVKTALNGFPEFNFYQQSASTFFSSTPGNPRFIEPTVRQAIEKIQRVAKISQDREDLLLTKKLLDNGFNSCFDIVINTGKVGFLNLMNGSAAGSPGAEIMTPTQALSIYNNAQAIYEIANSSAIFHLTSESQNALLPRVIAPTITPKPGESLPEGLPDMTTLFGSLDTCTCVECQSVYSAGAYLADLLNWLKRNVNGTGAPFVTGYDSLVFGANNANPSSPLNRRKDIIYLKLNCTNTNTVLPYIDLVNEILAVNLSSNYNTDIQNLQTTQTAESLAILPERRFTASENLLFSINYPWTLPYNVAFDETISYLDAMGNPLHRLIYSYSKFTDQYNSLTWAQAVLNINPQELTLLTAATSTAYTTHWGTTAAPTVKQVLNVTGLKIDELKAVLNLFCINGNSKISVQENASNPCDVSLYTFNIAFSLAISDNLMKLIRLTRKTKLSYSEIDLALKTLTSGNIVNNAFLIKLASAISLQKQFACAFSDIILLLSSQPYSDLFTSATSDYFKNRFLNSLLPDAIKTFFTSTYSTATIGVLSVPQKQALSTTLNIDLATLNALIAYHTAPGVALYTSSSTVQTALPILNKYAIFISYFEIDPAEISVYFGLLADPFLATDVYKAIWDFKLNFERVSKLPSSLSEIKAVSEGTGIYSLASTAAAAQTLWQATEDALQTAIKADPAKAYTTNPATIDVPYFTDIIISVIGHQFDISSVDTKAIIIGYNSSWITNFLANPAATTRTWSNNSASFQDIYRILFRAAAIKVITGLDDNGFSNAVTIKFATSPPTLPVAPFNWLLNSSIVALNNTTLFSYCWLAELNAMASDLGLTQDSTANSGIFYWVVNFCSNAASYITGPATQLTLFYNAISPLSSFGKVSLNEYSAVFERAKFITATASNTDLLGVLKMFAQIYEITAPNQLQITDAWSWIWSTGNWSTPATFATAISNDIRKFYQARFNIFSTWSTEILPTQNLLRSNMRDAFVAYHIATRGFSDAGEIYKYYLLDPEMDPCMLTSRLVAAISSTQLLIHRARLGRETKILLNNDNKKEWQWRKNYRVWEANRKVFLYPENWIDPTLRTDKTPFYIEAENQLQQAEYSDANSEQVFANYITSLNEISKLDIRAVYVEDPNTDPAGTNWNVYDTNANETLHVIGRTWNQPFKYFYRKLRLGAWSGWEPVDVEFDSDHLIPCIFNRKLYLFFPIFIEQVHKNFTDGTAANKPLLQDEDLKYYQIQLGYTKFDFGKWSTKKILNGSLLAGRFASKEFDQSAAGLLARIGKFSLTGYNRVGAIEQTSGFSEYSKCSLEKNDFYFWSKLDSSGDLTINIRRAIYPPASNPKTYTEFALEWGFKISACDERVEIVPPPDPEYVNNIYMPRFLARPTATMPFAQQMISDGEKKLFRRNWYSPYAQNSEFILRTQKKYLLTFPQQYKHNLGSQPFFYADNRRSFLFKATDNSANMFKVFANDHPFVCEMLSAINSKGIDGLFNPDNTSVLRRQQGYNPYPTNLTFNSQYGPIYGRIDTDVPKIEFDFRRSGPYSVYNWEIFFHSVSLIGRQLRTSNKFAEAIRWLGFIFDPSDTDLSAGTYRFWQTKPFMQSVSTQSIQNMIRLLSTNPTSATDIALKNDYINQINAWRLNPFEPHLLASMRPRAYMLWTVMEFVTTLTDWADYLFRQDTTESINEAINLYIMASEILGQRPKKVTRPAPPDKCFNDIQGNLSAFSNIITAFETNLIAASLSSGNLLDNNGSRGPRGSISEGNTAGNVAPDLLFCIPENPNLVALWDRVEDRLFKIRHCMNIDGIVRQLALFSPPIDPAMLVQAAAAGLSIESAIADSAAPLPYYRFNYTLQKANEFCSEVKALGNQLLGLLEKKDSEELSLFRQVHEQNILSAAKALKELALKDAQENQKILAYSKNLIQIKRDEYAGRKYRNAREEAAMKLTRAGDIIMYTEQAARLVAGILNLVPESHVFFHIQGIAAGSSMKTSVTSGQKLANGINAGANALTIASSALRNKASQSLTYANYDRREEDWRFQIKMAEEELAQVERQIIAAQIKIDSATSELNNHILQMEQSAAMYDWLKNKYTNAKLYSWLSGQVRTVYRQMYDLAFKLAKNAQTCMEYELGLSTQNIIQYGHWDTGKAGLLAGEKLSQQLKKLESEYIRQNFREYELSKNISLAMLNPVAIEQLKATGTVTFTIPEVIFDLDHPSHIFRRIKSVSLSIPCIAGPNVNISATLSLNSHFVRKTGGSTTVQMVPIPSERIATSSAQNDSGVYELNFRDERYLPFEGRGAVSTWTLTLTNINLTQDTLSRFVRQFDFNTIADVVLHMKYSAREAGSTQSTPVASTMVARLNALSQAQGLTHFNYGFSLRNDMPNQWNQFLSTGSTSVTIDKARLPYFMQTMNPKINKITAVILSKLSATTGQNFKINGTSIGATSLNSVPAGVTFIGSFTPSSAQSLNLTFTYGDAAGLLAADCKEVLLFVQLQL